MVQQEEPGQPQRVDDPELLHQTALRLRPDIGKRLLVALLEPRAAQLRELVHRRGILRARIPVAEVRAQIEAQALAQAGRLCDRLRILGKAGRHLRGRRQHMAEVPAPLRLRAVQRRMQPHRHERVLQRRPGARVGVDVAGDDARHPDAPREHLQAAVARAVVTQQGPLQLEAQTLGAEGLAQPAQCPLVVDAMPGATREAHQPVRVLEHRLQRRGRLRGRRAGTSLARVRVRARENATQVRPPPGVLHEQRDVATVLEVELRPVQGAQTQCLGGDRELHRARDRVVIGQRERVIAELERPRHQLVRHRHPVKEGEGGMAVELGICQGEHMFAYLRRPHYSRPEPRPPLDKLLVAANLSVVSSH